MVVPDRHGHRGPSSPGGSLKRAFAGSRTSWGHTDTVPHGEGNSAQQHGHHDVGDSTHDGVGDSASVLPNAEWASNDGFSLTQELARVMDGDVNDVPALSSHMHGDGGHSNCYGDGNVTLASLGIRPSRADTRPSTPSTVQSYAKRARRQAISPVIPPLPTVTPAVIAQLEVRLPPPDPVHVSRSDVEVATATQQ